ncbi:RagB/SusD family nutrient uptake outer membrane protein [uncultured Draconibacterium sp.]|uniref:RagB/SusD family nutrient uptake outer membrane protein n=1 Tax=uncultured Draconibacterium sp. TaxID=1573823 RepID=UPI0032171585
MKNIILIIIVFVLASCQDILELEPLDKFSDASVWNDENLIELYVNNSYLALGANFDAVSLFSSVTDETYGLHATNSYPYLRGEMTADNVSSIGTDYFGYSPGFSTWSSAYSAIKNINNYFIQIENSPVDDAKKTRMNSEMKYIRAYLYANLIWRYGGVPIITDVFELGQDYSVTRNTYDECVSFIISDLDYAITNLPAKQLNALKGRVSGDAARALKTRVLLYAASPLNNPSNTLSKWQAAADAAQELIMSGRYSLYNDYQHIFLEDNPEIIFAKYYTQTNGHQRNLYDGRNGSNGWGSNLPTQNLVDDYEMLNGKLPSESGSGYDPANPYVNRDPRFYASIIYDGAVWMGRETESYHGGLDSPESSNQGWNATLTGYNSKKFLPDNIPPSGSTIRPTNPNIYFRYAEILLNYAEAKFELGDEVTAREYLNMVRSRPGVNMPAIIATGDELRQKIYHERRIELAMEGQHRFFDVRRWKIAMETENKDILAMDVHKLGDGTKTYNIITLLERNFSEKHYLLPIPRVEIERSLETLTQNPGY